MVCWYALGMRAGKETHASWETRADGGVEPRHTHSKQPACGRSWGKNRWKIYPDSLIISTHFSSPRELTTTQYRLSGSSLTNFSILISQYLKDCHLYPTQDISCDMFLSKFIIGSNFYHPPPNTSVETCTVLELQLTSAIIWDRLVSNCSSSGQ